MTIRFVEEARREFLDGMRDEAIAHVTDLGLRVLAELC